MPPRSYTTENRNRPIDDTNGICVKKKSFFASHYAVQAPTIQPFMVFWLISEYVIIDGRYLKQKKV